MSKAGTVAAPAPPPAQFQPLHRKTQPISFNRWQNKANDFLSTSCGAKPESLNALSTYAIMACQFAFTTIIYVLYLLRKLFSA
jgi:hypothetical protein